MGIEEPHSYRQGGDSAPWCRTSLVRLLIFVLVGAALVYIVVRPAINRERGTTGLRLELFPGAPGVTLGERSLYPANDPWTTWLADEATCPRAEDALAPRDVQVEALLCLVNFARTREGLAPVALSSVLSVTAAAKARDIILCRDFSHEACGKQPFQAADDLGYRGSLGENLYVAEGALVAPRLALDTWLNSPGHRENLLQPQWRTIGISFLPGANLDDIDDGVVWVNHFGS